MKTKKRVKPDWDPEGEYYSNTYTNFIQNTNGKFFCMKCGCDKLHVIETEDGDIEIICSFDFETETVRY